MRTLLVVLLAIATVLLQAAYVEAKKGAILTNHCSTSLTRSDALDWPSKHAWNLFVVLNHPALDKHSGRGLPDCSKPIGAPGTTSVWETWRNAESEVYLSDGSEPPAWDDLSLPDEAPGETPRMNPGNRLRIDTASFHNTTGLPKPKFSPDGIFQGQGGIGESRMNRTTYEFIKNECLFSRQGQQRYAKAIKAGKKPLITFPVDSIEAKAVWIDFEREKIPVSKQNSYYTATYENRKYGLSSFHVITKDVPNWFWATFHHVDSPENPYDIEDTHGRPAVLRGTVWENYELGGTQNDFVTPTGSPTILSDHYIEYNFQRSSCISCHATATISATDERLVGQPLAVCSLTPELPEFGLDIETCKALLGPEAFITGTNKLLIERGPPNPSWFTKAGEDFFYQTDFVFSIPFRGRNESGPPPARCIW